MLAFSGALLLAACGPASRPDAPAAEQPVAEKAQPADRDGVRLALLEPSNDTDLAGLEGVLEAEGRCLYLAQPGASAGRTLLAFTIPGISWDPQRHALVAYGKTFAPGQRVLLGGSGTMNPKVHRWTQPPDPSCDTKAVAVVGTIEAAPGARRPG